MLQIANMLLDMLTRAHMCNRNLINRRAATVCATAEEYFGTQALHGAPLERNTGAEYMGSGPLKDS